MAAAFGVTGGIVLSAFVVESRPTGYLVRPLLAVLVVSLVVGLAASYVGYSAVVAVVAAVWVVSPFSNLAMAVTVLLGGLVVYRLVSKKTVDLDVPVAVAAGVFCAVGFIPIVGTVEPQALPLHFSGNFFDGPARFLILLDGYPRQDTLEGLGVDNAEFIAALEERGFDHYPDATSHHTRTWRTITHMLTGEPMESDEWGTSEEREAARQSWELPGYATLAPPFGSAVFPRSHLLNPGGFTAFDAQLLRDSIFRGVAGEWVIDGFEGQAERSLRILSTTTERRVFAHLFASHTPFTVGGPPPCWPDCDPFDIDAERLGYTVEEYALLLGEQLAWLNGRLIETIDAIRENHPTAEIVLFSDHGARYTEADLEEWHKTFLAAYTPTRPGLFADEPHPESVLDLVEGRD